jgi:hypothetical protein
MYIKYLISNKVPFSYFSIHEIQIQLQRGLTVSKKKINELLSVFSSSFIMVVKWRMRYAQYATWHVREKWEMHVKH